MSNLGKVQVIEVILNFKYNKDDGLLTWRYKAQNQSLKINDPKIVKCYEYLDKIFVLTVEEKTSVLYIYDGETKLDQKIVSTKDFFISGIREGIITPELIVRAKNKPAKIYIYNAKKHKIEETDEVLDK